MRLTGLQVAHGEAAPWWYGLAYYDPCRDYQIAYPIPVNLLVRWARDLLWLVRRGKVSELAESYWQGRDDAQAEWRDQDEVHWKTRRALLRRIEQLEGAMREVVTRIETPSREHNGD